MTQVELWSNRYQELLENIRPEHVALFVALQGMNGELPNGELPADELTKHGFRRTDAIEYLKRLETLGLGKFYNGRRQKVTRFKWNISAKTFGREFIARHQRGSGGHECLPSSERHVHRFLVRPGLEVEFSLPLNLSQDEANRLADYIKTLPF